MRLAPYDKKMLTHRAEWYPKHLLGGNDVKYELNFVRIQQSPIGAWDQTGSQETNYDNYRMIYDCVRSTGLPEGMRFAVGDTIKITRGPIWPVVMSITQVVPKPDLDGIHTHHYEIYMR